MMVLEIFGGWIFNSMALLASRLAYEFTYGGSRLGLFFAYLEWLVHYAHDKRFSFGTWKIEILAGYSSAIILMVMPILMGIRILLIV